MKITVTHQNVKVEVDDHRQDTILGYESNVNRVCQILHEIANQIRFINERPAKDLNWTKLYEQRK